MHHIEQFHWVHSPTHRICRRCAVGWSPNSGWRSKKNLARAPLYLCLHAIHTNAVASLKFGTFPHTFTPPPAPYQQDNVLGRGRYDARGDPVGRRRGNSWSATGRGPFICARKGSPRNEGTWVAAPPARRMMTIASSPFALHGIIPALWKERRNEECATAGWVGVDGDPCRRRRPRRSRVPCAPDPAR